MSLLRLLIRFRAGAVKSSIIKVGSDNTGALGYNNYRRIWTGENKCLDSVGAVVTTQFKTRPLCERVGDCFNTDGQKYFTAVVADFCSTNVFNSSWVPYRWLTSQACDDKPNCWLRAHGWDTDGDGVGAARRFTHPRS